MPPGAAAPVPHGRLVRLPQVASEVVALTSELARVRSDLGADLAALRADLEVDREEWERERERAAAAAAAEAGAAAAEMQIRMDMAAREARAVQERWAG